MLTGERLGFQTFATKWGMGKDENVNKVLKKLLCILNTKELTRANNVFTGRAFFLAYQTFCVWGFLVK